MPSPSSVAANVTWYTPASVKRGVQSKKPLTGSNVPPRTPSLKPRSPVTCPNRTRSPRLAPARRRAPETPQRLNRRQSSARPSSVSTGIISANATARPSATRNAPSSRQMRRSLAGAWTRTDAASGRTGRFSSCGGRASAKQRTSSSNPSPPAAETRNASRPAFENRSLISRLR